MDVETIAHHGWRVSLSDDVRVTDRHGLDVTSRSRKIRAIIAILVCAPGNRVARQGLVDLLWSDRGAEQARASLRQSLFTLRSEAPALVEADAEWVWLAPGAIVVADNDPMLATLARLVGFDPALDCWLAARAGCRAADTASDIPTAPRMAAVGSVTAAPRRTRRWPLAAAAACAMLVAAALAW